MVCPFRSLNNGRMNKPWLTVHFAKWSLRVCRPYRTLVKRKLCGQRSARRFELVHVHVIVIFSEHIHTHTHTYRKYIIKKKKTNNGSRTSRARDIHAPTYRLTAARSIPRKTESMLLLFIKFVLGPIPRPKFRLGYGFLVTVRNTPIKRQSAGI